MCQLIMAKCTLVLFFMETLSFDRACSRYWTIALIFSMSVLVCMSPIHLSILSSSFKVEIYFCILVYDRWTLSNNFSRASSFITGALKGSTSWMIGHMWKRFVQLSLISTTNTWLSRCKWSLSYRTSWIWPYVRWIYLYALATFLSTTKSGLPISMHDD